MAGLVEGKVGLVTGAAGGIGRATAVAFAREGAAGILVADLESKRDEAEETVQLIEAAGAQARFLPGDVTRASDQEALVTTTVDAFGRLDFAHNNAGIEYHSTIHETEEAESDRIIDVTPERQAELVAPQAMSRLGEPNEVAEAVVWLCSDRASFVTGIAMPVDAGSTAGVSTR